MQVPDSYYVIFVFISFAKSRADGNGTKEEEAKPLPALQRIYIKN